MTHFNRLIFQHFARCWLPVFLFAAFSAQNGQASSSDTGAVSATLLEALATHSGSGAGSMGGARTPVRAFATSAGLYELDTTLGGVRFWQRSSSGPELQRLNGDKVFKPRDDYELSRLVKAGRSVYRFVGKDADGGGSQFKSPVGIAKHPTEDKFAVVCGGEWIDSGLNKHCPSVQVYSYEETADSAGALSALEVKFDAAFFNTFYTTVKSQTLEIDGIDLYALVDETTVTNSVATNYVHVVDAGPPPEFLTNGVSVAEGFLLPADPQTNYVAGTAWRLLQPITYTVATTNFMAVTNYVTHYTYTTNANYLSTATDVAFLGDAGLVVSITGDERYDSVSGLVAFDLSDPSAEGRIFPVYGLPGAISGIDVDQETGIIYAAVPGAAAVYRLTPPVEGDPTSWLILPDRVGIREAESGTGLPGVPSWSVAAGVPGSPSSDWPLLSNPSDVSAWHPLAGETVLLAADTANDSVMGFDSEGNPLFRLAPEGGNSFNKPQGVFGIDGEDVLLVSDTGGRRSLLYDIDFTSLEKDDILAVEGVFHGGPDMSSVVSRTWFSTNDASGRLWAVWDGWSADFEATSALSELGPALFFPESDEVSNVVSFTVAPSRSERSYTLTVESDPDGVIELAEATAVVAPGETSGTFSFFGKDGIVAEGGLLPVEVLKIASDSDPSVSTNVQVIIVNAAPVVTNALAICHLENVGTPFFPQWVDVIDGFRALGKDVSADSELRYLWWATTNVNWAMNNLGWAVTNNDWEATASSSYWNLLNADDPAVLVSTNYVPYETPQWVVLNGVTNYFETTTGVASFFDPQASTSASGLSGVLVYVAAGRQVVVPSAETGYGADFRDVTRGRFDMYDRYPPYGNVYRHREVLVLTVLDKDGDAAILTYPFRDAPTAVGRWGLTLDPFVPEGGEENPAVYAAVFTAMSPTNLSFKVWAKSGTPASSDTVSLHSSGSLETPQTEWPVASGASQTSFPVGADILGGGEAVREYGPVELSPDGDAAFYVIQQP